MLTDEQVIILGAADRVCERGGRWVQPHEITWLVPELRSIRRWHALARKGLLDRMQQSEHVRGERRASWWMFRLNDAGRKAIEAHK